MVKSSACSNWTRAFSSAASGSVILGDSPIRGGTIPEPPPGGRLSTRFDPVWSRARTSSRLVRAYLRTPARWSRSPVDREAEGAPPPRPRSRASRGPGRSRRPGRLARNVGSILVVVEDEGAAVMGDGKAIEDVLVLVTHDEEHLADLLAVGCVHGPVVLDGLP